MYKLHVDLGYEQVLWDRHKLKFGDDIWRFQSSIHTYGAGDHIDFTRAARKFSQLAAHEHSSYVECLKLIAMYCLVGGLKTRAKAPSTVRIIIATLTRYFCCCLREGYTAQKFMQRADIIKIIRWNFMISEKGSRNSERHVKMVASCISTLYNYKRILPDYIESNPFRPSNWLNQFNLTQTSGWSAPPEPVVLYLIRRSIDILEEVGPTLIVAINLYITTVREVHRVGGSYKKVRLALDKIATELNISDIPRTADIISPYIILNTKNISFLLKRLQDACFLLITYTAGPRVSEVRRAHGSSLIYRKHLNGVEYPYFLVPRSKKRFGSSHPSSTSDDSPWILSPAAELALKTLIDISRQFRECSQSDNVWLSFSNGISLWPLKAENVRFETLSSQAFTNRLNMYSGFVMLREATGWTGRLHTHQGRKAFATFVAKRDRRSLGAVALQFSHSSVHTVDIFYARPDSEFRRLVSEELTRDMNSVVDQLIDREESIIESSSSLFFKGDFLTKREVQLLVGKGVALLPCQWGVCHYRKDYSACSGDLQLPNSEIRSPEVCAGCENLGVSKNNKAWWKEYLEDNQRFLRESNPSSLVRGVIGRRIELGNKIISRIDNHESC